MKKVILGILSGVLLLSGCSAQKSTQVVEKAEPKIKTSKPIYFMAGKIETNTKADVTTKLPAKVLQVMVDIGSKVKQGDPLIKLDVKDLEAQAQQAQAGVSTAQANLVKVKSGARPEQKAQVQLALESAKKNYENIKSNYERMSQLLQTGDVSKQQFEGIETQLTAAEAQYKSAQEQLNMLNNGETKETMDVLQAQVQQAKAALNAVQTQLSNGTILSPVSGVVTAKNVNVGELASIGAPLVSIVDTNSLVINAYLPTGLIDKVKEGQEVVVKVSEIPNKVFKGQVFMIDPVIDSKGRNILVKVSLKEKDPLLRPGMFAEIGLNI